MEKSSGICGKNTKQQTMSNHTSKNLKDLFVGYNYKYKSASTWDHFGNKNDATNYAKGELIGSNAATSAAFSWPPRSYSCSFCKREFRSAQALGGHMNVHRRDRARLHQSPVRDINNIGQYPLLNLNLDPNPNPSLTLLSSQANSAPHYPKCPHLATLPSISTSKIKNVRPLALDFMKMRSAKGLFGVEKMDPCGTVDVVKKAEFVRLDLEIGMISQAKYDHEEEEKLDLELRLGYTN